MDWMMAAGVHEQILGDEGEETRHPVAFLRDNRPTLLVAGPLQGCSALADWAARAGLRCIGQEELAGLSSRLSRTVSVDLVLIDLRNASTTMGALAALDPHTTFADAGLLILTDLESVDMALARFDDSSAHILCEPSTGEIVHLLVTAALQAERQGCAGKLHDSARPDESPHIAQLSEEVRRLTGAIDQLARQEASPCPLADTVPARALWATGAEPAETDDVMAADIRALLRSRRLRDRYLPADLFADPAWDMMLDLMAARLSGQRVCVSSLCIAAAVPPTTALRWIRQLTERGLFTRIDDQADGRRVFIALSDAAADAVTAWMGAVRRNGGLLQPVGAD